MVTPAEILTAVGEGDTAAIEAWFETGTRDVDETSGGLTLLYWAAIHDRYDVMISLLERGASVNSKNAEGCTPLHGAATYGRHDAAVLLLDRGAQIDLVGGHTGWTPLMCAADGGHCDMIRLLLSRGAALDARGKDGRTAEVLARIYDRYKAPQTVSSFPQSSHYEILALHSFFSLTFIETYFMKELDAFK